MGLRGVLEYEYLNVVEVEVTASNALDALDIVRYKLQRENNIQTVLDDGAQIL